MQRVVVPALVVAVLSVSALPASAQSSSGMGGGFIEFLFNGGDGAPPPQPRYRAAPPAPAAHYGQPARRGRYAQPDYAAQDDVYASQEPVYLDDRRSTSGYPQYGIRQSASQPVYAALPAAGSPVQTPIDPKFLPQDVEYTGSEKAGTIVIDTPKRFLYLVQENGKARRYGIGVGRPGFSWAGTHTITNKREWPDWRPPAEMLQRQPNLPRFMPGGPDNPLGARAMYLGSTLYRIHGSNEPWTIGHAVSSGCIRMRNEDVTDLYNRVNVGTKVIVI